MPNFVIYSDEKLSRYTKVFHRRRLMDKERIIQEFVPGKQVT
ncbi:ethanolamine utilization protein EutS, partial [Escherichia coli]|nr:ethanolamine utilization protein EutS [Escherichia coli]